MFRHIMNAGVIVAIVLSVIAVLAIAGVLLYLFVFRLRKMRKMVRDLDRRFEYLHALLIGQDAQYIKRLEIISRTNLLYVDVHTTFLRRFKDIRDHKDATSQTNMNLLKDLLDSKNYKDIKQAYLSCKETIALYEQDVTNLNNDLLKVIRPEEECRQASFEIKENLRAIKQEYFSKQSDLQLVQSSFDAVFAHIDSQFETYDSYVESANYEDANAMLPQIKKICSELQNILRTMPNLCVLANDIIPNKINDLQSTYHKMQEEKIPLHHLIMTTSIKELNTQLEGIVISMKNFEIKDVEERLNFISARVDEYLSLFEKEKNDQTTFESECDQVYLRVNNIEKEFIKLCNSIPEVKKIYQIGETYENKQSTIQANINKIGAAKRSLDTFIHSSTKQPYSILVGKMNELKDESNEVELEMHEFYSYLSSLKIDSESAYELIFSYYYRVKKAEKIMRDVNLSEFDKKYKPQIERIYELLDAINATLNILPINVELINQHVAAIKEEGEKTLNEIEHDSNMMKLAEAAILYANRDRGHLSDINTLVLQSEKSFFDGEFEKAYVDTGNMLRRFREESLGKKKKK